MGTMRPTGWYGNAWSRTHPFTGYTTHGGELINEWIGRSDQRQDAAKDRIVHPMVAMGNHVAQRDTNAGKPSTMLASVDEKNRILCATTADKTQEFSYTPSGFCVPSSTHELRPTFRRLHIHVFFIFKITQKSSGHIEMKYTVKLIANLIAAAIALSYGQISQADQEIIIDSVHPIQSIQSESAGDKRKWLMMLSNEWGPACRRGGARSNGDCFAAAFEATSAMGYSALFWDGQLKAWSAEGNKLMQVGDGRLQAGSLDAINGGQLFSELKKVSGQRGETGAQGPQGPRGYSGTQGPQGPQGPQGQNGDPGSKGLTGAPGPKGEKGDAGPRGLVGAAGAQGEKGAQGERGAPGAAGRDALNVLGDALMLGAAESEKQVRKIDMSGGGVPRVLAKVADGTQTSDAATIGQLRALGVVSNAGTALALAKGKTDVSTIDMAGGITAGRIVHGVKAGESDMDAVNVGQLKKLRDALQKLETQIQASNQASGNFTLDVKAGETVFEHDLAKRVRIANTVSDVKLLPLTNKDAGVLSLKKNSDGRYSLTFDAAADFHGVTHLTYTVIDTKMKEQSGRITINVLNQASL